MMLKFVLSVVLLAVAYGNQDMEKILKRLDQQEQQIKTLQSVVNSQAKASIREQVKQRKPVPEVAVYFSAALSATLDLASGGGVNYDDVITNAGSWYTSGIFTCPVGGYYLFSLTVKSDALHFAHVEVVMDGTVISSAMSVDGYDSASITVIVECSSGSEVSVRGGSNAGRIYGSGRYNVFTGQLLWVTA